MCGCDVVLFFIGEIEEIAYGFCIIDKGHLIADDLSLVIVHKLCWCDNMRRLDTLEFIEFLCAKCFVLVGVYFVGVVFAYIDTTFTTLCKKVLLGKRDGIAIGESKLHM